MHLMGIWAIYLPEASKSCCKCE